MEAQHLILLLYDSVTNSVFEGQVLKPFHQLLSRGRFSTITIVSYEKQDFLGSASTHPITQLLRNHAPDITYHFLERPFFWGPFSLRKSIKKLRTFLESQPPHTLIARGPISGYMARKAATFTTKELTIQARGLLYEEYCMTQKKQPFLLKPFHAYRAWHYKNIERHAYAAKTGHPFTVESVTPALTEYLIQNYSLKCPVTIATHDIPHKLSSQERFLARMHYRTMLSIADDAPVYVYNGSFKPWQYIDAVFSYIKHRLEENPKTILLCVSQDIQEAKKKALEYHFPEDACRYLSVPHQEVIPLLCAGDYGLLFREPHIVNWTSRPTKLLEYQSAGLTIIHNNTIDILQKDSTGLYAKPHTKLKETL